METNNALNQNPEDKIESAQEENSKPAAPKPADKKNAKKKVAKNVQADEEKQLPESNPDSGADQPSVTSDNDSVESTQKEPASEPDLTDEILEKETVPEKEKPSSAEAEEIQPPSEETPVDDTVIEDGEVPESKTPEEEAPAPEKVEPEIPIKDVEQSTAERTDKEVPEVKGSDEDDSLLVDGQDDDEDEEDDDQHDDHQEGEAEQINYDDLELEELLGIFETMVAEEEITSLRKKVALVKVAFLKKHKSKQEEQLEAIAKADDEEEEAIAEKDELEIRFNAAFKVYSDKRKEHLAQQEVQKQANLDTKKLILEELKALIESEESLKKTYDDFKELQEKWKAVGMVPKSEVNNLWQNYHFYVEKFFDKVKINKELRDLDLKKNQELKMELCEKAEELLLESSILKSFKQLQQYHRQWKEIGPVPQDKKDELWERFKSTTEKINQTRRDHYNKLKEDQETNLVKKTELCEKAEEVLKRETASVKEWQAGTQDISELLKEWKTLGPAPRKQNDEIWDRFKTSLDSFFASKKEYFQTIKDEQLHNYNLKLDLCAQAEAIKDSTDWKQTTRDLINLQKDWKNIGPVPRKHSDKVWQRFRAACDEFFNNKSSYFSNIKSHEANNLKAKEELITKVETFEFGPDKNENLETLKSFQREWTEIGHVPFKEKDKIQLAFRKVINNQLDNLKISKAEMQTVNFKQRFENIKDKPDAGRIVRNERHFLVQKMKKLEDEIQLLENNMGFLAKSKKADLLKVEFTKKIDDARAEVQVIKEKIKFLEREAE